MLRHIKLAIKKPHLIKDIIYKKHLGIILSCDVREYNSELTMLRKKESYYFEKSTNPETIVGFYNNAGRSAITTEKVVKWLERGNQCWLAYYNGVVVGGTWIFFSEVSFPHLSSRVLSKDKSIKFDKDIAYRAYVLINEEYRGMGIYNLLSDEIMRSLYKEGEIKKLILITGASNAPVIRTIMKSKGKLIGIVEVKNLLGIIFRKEIFIDEKERVWW